MEMGAEEEELMEGDADDADDADDDDDDKASDELVEQITKRVAARILKSALTKKK